MSALHPLETHAAGVLGRLHLLDARIALALSGGLDSSVLLHVLHAIAQRHPLRLSAVHVDHGISPHSAGWAQTCAERCAELDVPLVTARVQVPRDTGSGLEAAARAVRYAVYARQAVDAVALAHHLDDQGETVLLQLLRGAGASGLAAMPEARALPGSSAQLVRPLLTVPRARLEDYARERGLRWIDDESNQSLDFDRNYLRHEVLPRIGARFPAYRETFLRASRNAADLAAVCAEMARIDAATVLADEGLRAAALRALAPERRANLLRWFLQSRGVPSQPRERLEEALDQLLAAGADRSPVIQMGAAALRRHRGVIRIVPARMPGADWRVVWHGETALQLPAAAGVLRFHRVVGEGLSAARLRDSTVVVAPRRGGERIKLAPQRPQRSLKDVLRESGLAPWMRERLPLVFCNEALAWVPGIGADCRLAAAPGEPGVLPEWSGPEP